MLPDQIKKLYWDEGLSASEIGKKFNVTKWQIYKRMKKYQIPRRTQWETHRIQYARQPLSYTRKTKLNPTESILLNSALMLYWAEGSKRNKYTVDLANCDEKILLIFLKALRKIYQVDEKKLRVFIYCYANQDSKKIITYWSNLFQIPEIQFTKPYIRKDFQESETNKMPHGLAHIRYADKKLLMQIMSEIDIIQASLLSKLRWRSGRSHETVNFAPGRAS